MQVWHSSVVEAILVFREGPGPACLGHGGQLPRDLRHVTGRRAPAECSTRAAATTAPWHRGLAWVGHGPLRGAAQRGARRGTGKARGGPVSGF